MSFLNNKTINPHIHLHALTLAPLAQAKDTPLHTLNLLAKTRRFNDILAAAKAVGNLQFPTLANSRAMLN